MSNKNKNVQSEFNSNWKTVAKEAVKWTVASAYGPVGHALYAADKLHKNKKKKKK